MNKKTPLTPLQIREATITYHLKSSSGEQLQSNVVSDHEIIALAAQFKASLEQLGYYKFCFYQAETSAEGNLHFQC